MSEEYSDFAKSFTAFCVFFERYKTTHYREITNNHIGYFKRKAEYNTLVHLATKELYMDTFVTFTTTLVKIAIETYSEETRHFSGSTISFIRDCRDYSTHFTANSNHKFQDSDKAIYAEFVEKGESMYEITDSFNSVFNGFQRSVIPETLTEAEEEGSSDEHTALNDSRIISFFELFKTEMMEMLNTSVNDRIASEFSRHLGIDRELTSDQVKEYQKKMMYTYKKILIKQNDIKILETHLNKKHTPKQLCHKNYPTPFLKHDDIFITKYNQLIEKWQVETMNLAIERLREHVKILESDLALFKSILTKYVDVKSHVDHVQQTIQEILI